jgi:hypothetical protein
MEAKWFRFPALVCCAQRQHHGEHYMGFVAGFEGDYGTYWRSATSAASISAS